MVTRSHQKTENIFKEQPRTAEKEGNSVYKGDD